MAGELLQVKPVGTNNWVSIPTPSTYKMTSTTLVDSSRNTKGIVVSQVVREGIRKIEVTWKFLSQDNYSLIAKLFEDASVGGTGGFMCYLKYYDTIRGTLIDSSSEHIMGDASLPYRTFYVGDRVSDNAQLKLDSQNKIQGYANVKLSLIEC